MNEFDRELRRMAAEERYEVPESVHQRVEDVLADLPEKKAKVVPFYRRWHLSACAACAALLIVVILPNMSMAYATAVDGIPVLGDLVRVVTIRNYSYNSDTHELELRVPGVRGSGESSETINLEVEQMVEELKGQFYAELEADGEEGKETLVMDYDVLCNTSRWFTLRLAVNTVRASSDMTFKYYNVDRVGGRIVTLGDLFTSVDEYSQRIAGDIQRQMREQMAADENIVYWIDKADFGTDFTAVDSGHNYYFNDAGDLVIPFDKYEVGPGSMGSPEFVVSREAIADILKPEYQDMSRN